MGLDFCCAGAVTVGSVIVAPIVGIVLQGAPIAWPSRSTGKRKMEKNPIAKRNREEDVRKTASEKKPWMIGVQHLITLVVIY